MKPPPHDKIDQSDDLAFPTLSLDPDQYRHHLDDLEIPDEQADEFLHVLWKIMCAMVDLGWGLDNIQMFLPPDTEFTGQDSGNDSTIKNTRHSFNNTATTQKG